MFDEINFLCLSVCLRSKKQRNIIHLSIYLNLYIYLSRRLNLYYVDMTQFQPKLTN
jgi:hypothetical protein